MRFRIDPEIGGDGIVLHGKFNPAILTPAWFAMRGLLPTSAAENAQVQVIHAQVMAFSTEWLQVDANVDRFQAATTHEPYVRLRDLVIDL